MADSYINLDQVRRHLKEQEERGALKFKPERSSFKRERFDEIEPAETEWLVKHFLPASGVGIIAGPPTVGKSFVTLYLSLRIALGKDVLAHRSRQSGILYVAAEGQNGMRKRIKALRDKFEIKTSAFQFIGQAPNLMDEENMADLAASAVEAGVEMQEEAGVDLGLIVIDTTAASMPGANENAGEDMSVVLSNAGKLSVKTGALVLMVGHTGKDETLGVRGWSGQIGNSDVIIYLTKDEVDPLLRGGIVHKLKDGEDGEKFAYRLKQIHMGYDQDGDAVTSAYPVFEDPASDDAGKRKSRTGMAPGATLIMRALRVMLEAGQGLIVPPVPGVPPGCMGVKRTCLRDRAVQMGYSDPDEKPETVKRAFNREILNLTAAKEVRVEGDLVWPIR